MLDFLGRLVDRTDPRERAFLDVEQTFESGTLAAADKPALAQCRLDKYFDSRDESHWLGDGRTFMDRGLTHPSPEFRGFFIDGALVPVLVQRLPCFADAELILINQEHCAQTAAREITAFAPVLNDAEYLALHVTVQSIVESTSEQHDLALVYAEHMSPVALAQTARFFAVPEQEAMVRKLASLIALCEQSIANGIPVPPLTRAERPKADRAAKMLEVTEPDAIPHLGIQYRDKILAIVSRGMTDAELLTLTAFFGSEAGREYVYVKFLAEEHLEKRRGHMHEQALKAALAALGPQGDSFVGAGSSAVSADSRAA